ncbi:hypothetical protein DFP73DRAFT_529363 [Morchella snyderi]|nr:hypothetical protein DFP73DRAFT_529363 [Morchella snyderi]
MPSPSSHSHKLQRRYFPITLDLPNCTSTHHQTHLDNPPKTVPNTIHNTVPIAILMMSTTRTPNRRTTSHPHIQSPNSYFNDYPFPTPRYFTEAPPVSPNPPTVAAHPPIEATHLPTPQPSQSAEASQLDPDAETSFSPISHLHRSDGDSEDEGEKEKEKEVKLEVDEFDEDESEWQDAQKRDSQMSSREEEGMWADPLECVLGAQAMLADEWVVIDGDEEEGGDEWIDDQDWCSAEAQD